MKKLIIIGNKNIDHDISSIIDGFDHIVRLNRMTNYGSTGHNTDLLLVDFHDEFFKLVEKPYDKYLNAKTLLVNIDVPISFYLRGISNGIITKDQLAASKKISLRSVAKKLLGEQNWLKNKTMPTNYFLLTSYVVENYINDFEIWTVGADIDNRDILFNTTDAYKNSWHTNIGKFESKMLNKWIQEDKLHVLEC